MLTAATEHATAQLGPGPTQQLEHDGAAGSVAHARARSPANLRCARMPAMSGRSSTRYSVHQGKMVDDILPRPQMLC